MTIFISLVSSTLSQAQGAVRNLLLTAAMSLPVFLTFGQGTISGPTYPTVSGGTTNYEYSNFYTSAQWTIIPASIGTITNTWFNANKTIAYASIKWNYSGFATIQLRKNNVTTVIAYTEVEVQCGSMSAPSIVVTRMSPQPVTQTSFSCGSGSFQINATLPSNGVAARWYTSSSGGSYFHQGSSYTTPTLNSTTTYYVSTYYGSLADENLCESTRVPVTLTIAPTPSNPTSPFQEIPICGSGATQLYANIGANGNTLNWYNSNQGYIGQGSTYFTGSMSSPTTYYVATYNTTTGCVSSLIPYTTIVSQVPAPPQGIPGARCGTGAVTLSANPGTAGGTIRWDNGSSVLGTSTSYTTPSISASTTYYARTSLANQVGVCLSSPTSVVATVHTIPSTPTLNPITSCPGTVTLSGTVGSGGSYIRWYTAQSGGSETTAQQSLSSSTTFWGSSYNSSTGCESARASVTVTINPTPAAPTFQFYTYICGTSGSAEIGATAPAGSEVKWYSVATGGTPLTADVPSGAQFTTPTLTAATTYYIASRNTTTGCFSSTRTPVPVTLNPIPASPSNVSSAARCGTGTVTLTATGSATLNWYDNTTYVGTGASYTTPSLSASKTYTVKNVSSVGCVSPGVEAYATINPIPADAASTGLSSTFARGHGRITLIAMLNTRWYSVATGGSHLGEGFNFLTPDLSAPVTYYAATRDVATGCEGPRSPIVAQVLPLITNGKSMSDVLRVARPLSDSSLIASLPVTEVATSVTYFDGLLRPVQQAIKGLSVGGFDVVQPIQYDAFGRSPKEYLPYVAQTNDASFHPNFASEQLSFFAASNDQIANDSQPYRQTEYEDSPLARPIEAGNFGVGFQPDSNRTVRISYAYNNGSTNSEAEEVRRFNSNGTSSDFYPANSLYRLESKDPDNNRVISFTDGSGRVISKRQQLDEVINGDSVRFLQTYYIYDDFGRIRFIISPKGVHQLRTNGWNMTPIMNQFVYQFTYDHRGRIIEKKVPAQAPMYYIYDQMNRLILAQDGLMRSQNKWMFIKYDRQGREVMQGFYTTAAGKTRATIQSDVDQMYQAGHATFGENSWYEERAVAPTGYTLNSYPKINDASTPLEIYTIKYYDSHDFDYNGAVDYYYTVQNLPNENVPGSCDGYVSGEKRLILGTSNWLTSYVFYDQYGRVIQTRSNDHLTPAVIENLTTNVYDFEGKLLSSRSFNRNAPDVVYRYEYDNGGRIENIYGPAPVGEDVTWAAGTNVTTNGSSVTKSVATASWDSGSLSTNSLAANESGWVEFRADNTSTYKMLGLAISNSGASYTSINYAIYLSAGNLHIYESGTQQPYTGTYAINDVFAVERKSGKIYYRKNNAIIYISPVASESRQLFADCAFHTSAGSFTGVKLFRPAEVKLANYSYNKLGQLVDKKLYNTSGNDFLQSVDYRYSIRGQLQSINNASLNVQAEVNDDANDVFGIEFLYNQKDLGINNKQMYGGNISAIKWKGPGAETGLTDQRSYKYLYDKANQLRSGTSAVRSVNGWNKEVGALNESMTYDHNGNVVTLQRNQRQHNLVGVNATYISQAMDNLTYTYNAAMGDQLIKVEDATGNANGFKNGSIASTEYTYDTNGNILTDLNKNITSNITYNLLGKPTLINFADGKKVDYQYDGAGNKLRMRTLQGTTVLTTTDYVGGSVYESGILKFYSSPEGRVVMDGTKREYQFAISDHQGNTRVVLTSQTPTAYAPKATFEGNADDKSGEFKNVANVVSFIAANETPGGIKVVRMNQSYPVGPSKSLKVYPGDKVDMEVSAYFENSSGFGLNNVAVGTMITNVASAFTLGLPSGEASAVNTAVNDAVTTFGLGGNQGDGVPAAYLNYILYDKDYKLLNAGWQAVPASANFTKQKISIPTRHITEAGYIFVYLSYENQSNNYVYFDDFKVTHTKTNVIQYNEYYPFGLQASTSWTREGNKNDFLYNAGSEINVTTGWYDLPFRNYDPALGRFMQVDPMSVSEMATYQYGANNPVFYNDRFGLAVNPKDIDRWALAKAASARPSYEDWTDTSFMPGSGGHWSDNVGKPTPGAVTTMNDFLNEAINGSGGSWNANGESVQFDEWYDAYEYLELQITDWYNGETGEKLDPTVEVVRKDAGNGGPDPTGCPPGVPCDQNKPQTQQAGLDGGEHLIGPTMVLLGQPLEVLKPVGALGSKPGSSVASYTLSKTITYSSPVIKQVTGTAVLGRALGRFVPWVGWGLTAYDVWDNRVIIGEFLKGMKETNQQNSYKKDGTWSTEWHVR